MEKSSAEAVGYVKAGWIAEFAAGDLPAVTILVQVFGIPITTIARHVGVSQQFLSVCYDPQDSRKLPVARYRKAVELLGHVLAGARRQAKERARSKRPGDEILRLTIKAANRVMVKELQRLQDIEADPGDSAPADSETPMPGANT